MNPLRYFICAAAFSALLGYRIRPGFLGILAGRAVGGSIVSLLQRRR